MTGYYLLGLNKNKNNYGFLGIRNNELYTDYNINDGAKFYSFKDAKPYIDRLVKAGFRVRLYGTGDFSKDRRIFENKGNKLMEEKNLKKIFDDAFSGGGMPAIETANGVMYLEPKDNKIIIGGATNAGVIPQYEFDYDFDQSFDWNIQGMIEQVLEKEGYPEDEYDENYKGRKSMKKSVNEKRVAKTPDKYSKALKDRAIENGWLNLSKKEIDKKIKELQKKGWYDNYSLDMGLLYHLKDVGNTFSESKINEGNYDYDNAWLGFCTNVKRHSTGEEVSIEDAIDAELDDLVYTSDIINVWKDMPGNLGSRINEITDLMRQDIQEGAYDDINFISNLDESKKSVNENMSVAKAKKLYKKHGMLFLDDEEGQEAYDVLYNAGYTMKKKNDVAYCVEFDRMRESLERRKSAKKSVNEVNRWATEDEVSDDDYLDTFEYIYSSLVNGNISQYKKQLKRLASEGALREYQSWAEEMGVDPKIVRFLESYKGKKSVNEISDRTKNRALAARDKRAKAAIDKQNRWNQRSFRKPSDEFKDVKTEDDAMAIHKTAWKETDKMWKNIRRQPNMDTYKKRVRSGAISLGKDKLAESLSQSILKDAHSVLTMNESEAGEMTTWQFTARGFSKAMINKQPVFGSDNIRCIIHENSNGKVVGTAVVDYYMSETQVEEAIKKALAENGFRASNITNLVNLF